MSKDNIKFTTSGGTEIEFRPYLTGKDALELAEISAPTPEKKNSLIAQKGIEQLVVSVNGSTEHCLKAILDLPVDEYLEIRKQVDEIAELKKKATPKTSGISSTDA